MFKNFPKITKKILCCMQYSSRIKQLEYLVAPVKTTIDESKLPPPTKIDKTTIEYLEKASLVGFENDKAVKIVEEAIRFADRIFEANTEDVEPLVTVLENESLHLREDIVKNDVSRQELFSHCATCIENYYITPAANAKNDLKQSIDQPSTKIIQSVQEEKACEN